VSKGGKKRNNKGERPTDTGKNRRTARSDSTGTEEKKIRGGTKKPERQSGKSLAKVEGNPLCKKFATTKKKPGRGGEPLGKCASEDRPDGKPARNLSGKCFRGKEKNGWKEREDLED